MVFGDTFEYEAVLSGDGEEIEGGHHFLDSDLCDRFILGFDSDVHRAVESEGGDFLQDHRIERIRLLLLFLSRAEKHHEQGAHEAERGEDPSEGLISVLEQEMLVEFRILRCHDRQLRGILPFVIRYRGEVHLDEGDGFRARPMQCACDG